MRRFFRYYLRGLMPLMFLLPLSGEALRIATYNLDNYLVMDRNIGARWRPSYPKPESEKVIIRQIIGEIAPDILVLQEMGSLDFLEELRSDLIQEGVHYTYAIHMQAADPVRHLAVLSKHAPQAVVKHTDLDFKYIRERQLVKRGMLEMTFKLSDDQLFQLFVIHLKSRYTDVREDEESQLRRVREAEACRNRIIERTYENDRTDFLIVGDFNDHPVSAPMRRFYRRGNLEIGSLVPATDSRGELWTYFYEREARYECVDGFIASPAMLARIKAGHGHVVDSPGALSGSDHRMVYLDLLQSSSELESFE
ncbi:endonuclease/exonuclease/phosphatase family protein [Coraliomargarita sp. SDUM461004]|uniref:Endonuclease/exonuclease/phosphatase family protein n=1 Tax=Thalassobacterium sedimentorum TaxID=3041258 RepID=A0ABU1AG90_9BACT|nr:endonuclease/exonuclease/phosphatase family protein [Coraliomargarita sp. SDUM461004]MDQ8193847.1 endonuclease/exonuclease/phosphatase family protein [Coraliomargarita sp. SDUM461004]